MEDKRIAYIFADFITEKRKEQELTQIKISEDANINNRTYANYEQRKMQPNIEIADNILRALGYKLVIVKLEDNK